jgi:hypothetical protein
MIELRRPSCIERYTSLKPTRLFRRVLDFANSCIAFIVFTYSLTAHLKLIPESRMFASLTANQANTSSPSLIRTRSKLCIQARIPGSCVRKETIVHSYRTPILHLGTIYPIPFYPICIVHPENSKETHTQILQILARF